MLGNPDCGRQQLEDYIPAFQEVLATLETVLQLVDCHGTWSGTVPPSVHVTVTCPKVTVQLRSSASPSRSFSISRMQRSRGQSSPLICQLSLHDLQLVEERANRTCHSLGTAGQIPKSCPQRVVKASIGRLHLTTADEQAASADEAPPAKRAPSCVATSPAAGEATLQHQVSANVTAATQLLAVTSFGTDS